jgi:hypothetical protein
MPHYVCEICYVQAQLDHETFPQSVDVALTMVKRVRQVDYMGGWFLSTLKKYGPYLQCLSRFETRFGIRILETPTLIRPPISPAYTLMARSNGSVLPRSNRSVVQHHGTLPRLCPCSILDKSCVIASVKE